MKRRSPGSVERRKIGEKRRRKRGEKAGFIVSRSVFIEMEMFVNIVQTALTPAEIRIMSTGRC